MILRTIECSVCGYRFTEPKENEGFAGWGQLRGVSMNGHDDPHLCPSHLADAANFIDSLAVKK